MAKRPNLRPRPATGLRNESKFPGPPTPKSAAATAPRELEKPASSYDPETGADTADTDRVTRIVVPPSESVAASGIGADVMLEQTSSDLASDIDKIRRMRKPLGSMNQKLALAKRPGYYRHWFNDVAGRLDEAKAAGYAYIRNSEGQSLKRVVGTGRDGGALHAFAMEIPHVFFDEDQGRKNQIAAEMLDTVRRKPFMAPAGSAKPTDRGKFYSPDTVEDVVGIDKDNSTEQITHI